MARIATSNILSTILPDMSSSFGYIFWLLNDQHVTLHSTSIYPTHFRLRLSVLSSLSSFRFGLFTSSAERIRICSFKPFFGYWYVFSPVFLIIGFEEAFRGDLEEAVFLSEANPTTNRALSLTLRDSAK
ncbi:uncharacterized protein LOC144716582 [Wolffia australiana]